MAVRQSTIIYTLQANIFMTLTGKKHSVYKIYYIIILLRLF